MGFWVYLSKSIYKEKEEFVNKKYKEYRAEAAYKIQEWCLQIIVSPHYKIGRTMIDKKYDELFD